MPFVADCKQTRHAFQGDVLMLIANKHDMLSNMMFLQDEVLRYCVGGVGGVGGVF